MTDQNTNHEDFWADAEVISTYLVADAVRDGQMRHVDRALSTEAGFTIPVVMTTGAWTHLVTWERTDEHEDEEGRLWDVLYMAHVAARATRPGESWARCLVIRTPNRTASGALSTAQRPDRVEFHAVVQAYDTSGDPCLTIYLPEER